MRGLRTYFSDVWKGALNVCRKRIVDVQAYVDCNVTLALHAVFCLLHIYYNSLYPTLTMWRVVLYSPSRSNFAFSLGSFCVWQAL